MKITFAILLVIAAGPAAARSSDNRPFDHFGHKDCKSSSCFEKHPSGSYTFPYHEGRRH